MISCDDIKDWENKTAEKRFELMAQAVNNALDSWGLERSVDVVLDVPPAEARGEYEPGDLWGEYDQGTLTIYFSPSVLEQPVDEAISTAIHEAVHAAQHQIGDPPAGAGGGAGWYEFLPDGGVEAEAAYYSQLEALSIFSGCDETPESASNPSPIPGI